MTGSKCSKLCRCIKLYQIKSNIPLSLRFVLVQLKVICDEFQRQIFQQMWIGPRIGLFNQNFILTSSSYIIFACTTTWPRKQYLLRCLDNCNGVYGVCFDESQRKVAYRYSVIRSMCKAWYYGEETLPAFECYSEITMYDLWQSWCVSVHSTLISATLLPVNLDLMEDSDGRDCMNSIPSNSCNALCHSTFVCFLFAISNSSQWWSRRCNS